MIRRKCFLSKTSFRSGNDSLQVPEKRFSLALRKHRLPDVIRKGNSQRHDGENHRGNFDGKPFRVFRIGQDKCGPDTRLSHQTAKYRVDRSFVRQGNQRQKQQTQ